MRISVPTETAPREQRVALAPDSVARLIKQLKLDEVAMLAPPLAAFPVYHYLHKKHAALVPQLAAVLRQMRADKVIENIQQRVAAGS